MAKLTDTQKNDLNQELLNAVLQMNETEVIQLLNQGADPDMRNESGDTLLNLMLSSETISPKLIETLVEAGAHLNYVSSDRVTPLMCAVYNMNVPFETVSYLLQAGASVYSRDTYGQTPLLYATSREDVALIDLLLTYGSSVNETDADGNSLVFEAVRQGYENLFSYLVDQGADLTVRDYQGLTLLMAAILQKQEKMVTMLLDFPEIDVLATRVDGLTALDMVLDLAAEEGENQSFWKGLSETLSLKVSERLSFLDTLDESSTYGSEWADLDEESADEMEDDLDEDFLERKEPIGDGFDDFNIEEEITFSPDAYGFEEDETNEDFSLEATPKMKPVPLAPSLHITEEDEEDLSFALAEEGASEEDEEDLPFMLEEEGFQEEGTTEEDENDLPFALEEEGASEEDEEDLPFALKEEGFQEEDEDEIDVEGIDDDMPTYQEVIEKVSLSPSQPISEELSQEESLQEEDEDDLPFMLEDEGASEEDEEDLPFALKEEGFQEEDEDEIDVEGIDDDMPTYQEVIEKVSLSPSQPISEELSQEESLQEEDEDDLPFMLEDEGITEEDEDDLPFMQEDEGTTEEDENDLPFMLEDEGTTEEDENDLPFMLEDEGITEEDEEDLPFMQEDEGTTEEDEDDLPFMLEEENMEGFEDNMSTYQEVVEKVDVSPSSQEDDFSLEEETEEEVDFSLELENEEVDEAYSQYVFSDTDNVESNLVQVDPTHMTSTLHADEVQAAVAAVKDLPLYPQEVYQHAAKMLKRYTEYQSEDGQKGVYISGVYLNNKACSQARVHIERMLLEQGYVPEQAHEQSVVILYKLIRANGLYHPKEFVLLENGEKALAFKVWGCDHRVLLKSLTNEFAPEGDWYHSLSEIEKYVGEKGEGKLTIVA